MYPDNRRLRFSAAYLYLLLAIGSGLRILPTTFPVDVLLTIAICIMAPQQNTRRTAGLECRRTIIPYFARGNDVA
jgi:hypothetical protein